VLQHDGISLTGDLGTPADRDDLDVSGWIVIASTLFPGQRSTNSNWDDEHRPFRDFLLPSRPSHLVPGAVGWAAIRRRQQQSCEFGLEDFGYGAGAGEAGWERCQACDDEHAAWHDGNQRPQRRVGHRSPVTHGADQGDAEQRARQRWEDLHCG
jgi:hypothetical protein